MKQGFSGVLKPGSTRAIGSGYSNASASTLSAAPCSMSRNRIETGPGEIRWFWDRGRAIWNESGSPVRMSGSIRDVTESKDGADHGYPSSVDLHLPLRTIESFRQTLLEGSLSESGQDGTAIAARAAPYARRMEALVNDLGTLSQAMDAPLQRTEVDLSALARSIARRLRRDEPDRTATISVASGPDGQRRPRT